MQLRQSLKFILASYITCMLLAVAICVYWLSNQANDYAKWLFLIPAVLLIWTMVRHVERRLTKITIMGDRLKYEAGLLNRTTRTMELAKVQDVRVDQTLLQRIFGIGDLSLETAGETSRIELDGIDRPQEAADHILELARTHRPKNGPPAMPNQQGL